MPQKRLIGKVVSDKMQKTVVVEVERLKEHPKYHQRYKIHKRYKAHDENSQYKEGSIVIIEASSPFSKEKRWRVVGYARPPKADNNEENAKDV